METPEDKWFALSLKAVEQLDLAGQNWNSLDNNIQELAALWKLEADMNNGGFIQFFVTGVMNAMKLRYEG